MKNTKEIFELLKKTREGKGLTIEDVYKKSLIHPNILKGMEDGSAEKKLTKVYLKGFIRKYAVCLGLDPSEVLKGFEAQHRQNVEQKLHVDAEDEAGSDMSGYIKALSVLVLAGICAAAIFIGVWGVTRFVSGIYAGHKERAAKRAVLAKENRPSARPDTGKAPAIPGQEALRPAASAAVPENKVQASVSEVSLRLAASDVVWIRLERDDSVVFKGTLNKGSVESWTAKKSIKARVGKLEALEFTVNGKSLGRLGSGTTDILVDKRGIRIGDKFYPA
ncbi:MAG: RodZ domain-containing protein [Candidatus Omnitrophota bacterium]